MNKLEIYALATFLLKRGFDPDEAMALEQIIEATGNPSVCVEMLCDLYEEPKIPLTPVKPFSYTNRTLYVFDSYNKFTNRIRYSYSQIPQETVWVLKSATELPAYGSSCTEAKEYDSKAYRVKLDLSLEDFTNTYARKTIVGPPKEDELLYDHCDLEDWLDKPKIRK